MEGREQKDTGQERSDQERSDQERSDQDDGYIILPKLITDDEIRESEGEFYDSSSFNHLIEDSIDAFNEDGVLIFSFRKNAIASNLTHEAFQALLPTARKMRTNNRGVASGKVRLESLSANVVGLVSPGRHKSRLIYADGSQSLSPVANKIPSFIAGYFDEPILKFKGTEKGQPCRQTVFTRDKVEEWKNVVPLIEKVNDLYAFLLPTEHAIRRKLMSEIPDYRIGNTVFSTITINTNWRTALHVDKNDYRDGISALVVCSQGQWGGCYLGYPQYGVCVNVRQGDLLLMNPHEYHCNTELYLESDDATRLSMVIYTREKIGKCATATTNLLKSPRVVKSPRTTRATKRIPKVKNF